MKNKVMENHTADNCEQKRKDRQQALSLKDSSHKLQQNFSILRAVWKHFFKMKVSSVQNLITFYELWKYSGNVMLCFLFLDEKTKSVVFSD